MDRLTGLLVDALKTALAEPGEHRLYRSGKLDGLFSSRTGVHAEAAAKAVQGGLLEVVRTESKGKVVTEWVRHTPRATDFLHDHESPVRALRDLREVLQANQQSVPLWLADMQRELQTLSQRMAEEAQRWTERLHALTERADQALRRLEPAGPEMAAALGADAEWATRARAYLERRRAAGAPGPCPLPELFASIRQHDAQLTITGFHDRLRRLHDREALQLLPFDGPPQEMKEPEYALVDGTALLYYATAG